MIELYRTSLYVYMICDDPAAGRKHRYSVHAIMLFGDKRAEVIGRELPLVTARRVIRDRVAQSRPALRPPSVKPQGSMARGRRL